MAWPFAWKVALLGQIAALGVFVIAAAFSLREGIDELIHPSATSSFVVAYVVLAISTVLDLVSFRQSAGQMISRARRYHREFLEESRITSDPSLRAVFAEDAVSVSGDVIAFAALALNQVTGSSIPRGVAAVLIALVLIRVSLRLIQRSHDFLVGSWARGRRIAGRRCCWLHSADDGLRSGRVKALVRGIESGMKHEAKDIYRVDVVPIGETQPASS